MHFLSLIVMPVHKWSWFEWPASPVISCGTANVGLLPASGEDGASQSSPERAAKAKGMNCPHSGCGVDVGGRSRAEVIIAFVGSSVSTQ